MKPDSTSTAVEPPSFEEVAAEAVSALSERIGLPEWGIVGINGTTPDLIDLAGRERFRRPSAAALQELVERARTDDPVVVLDVDAAGEGAAGEDAAGEALAGIERDLGSGTVVAAPLRDGGGTVLGVLVGTGPALSVAADVARREIGLTGRLLGALWSLSIARDAALRRSEAARRAALRDALTGLLNRAGWDQAIADEEIRASRYGLPAAVVIVDLDQLKEVNDTHGHAEGDELLRSAADVMRVWHRRSDVLARLGGDEFAALLVQTGEAAATQAAERLREDLASAGISASVGVAGRWANVSLDRAVIAADRAMYAEKRRRRERSSLPPWPPTTSVA